MTATTDTGPQSVNGTTAPGAAQQQAPGDSYLPPLPGANTAETLMGLVGIAIALGLLAIGIDLMTGGAVSRMFGASEAGSGDDARP